MKQGFMSIDGKFFTSEVKCKEHEDTVGFVMYDDKGIVDDPNLALAVTILSEAGYKKFCDLCNCSDSTHYKILGVGNWVWDDDRNKYIYLSDAYFKSIARMYNDKYGNIDG